MREQSPPAAPFLDEQMRLYSPVGDPPFSEDPRTDPRIEGTRPVPRWRWYRPQRPPLRRTLRPTER
jgi:hypothetical protein